MTQKSLHCPTCGEPVDEFPERIVIVVNEDQAVELERRLYGWDDDLYGLVRGAHLAGFARWHG